MIKNPKIEDFKTEEYEGMTVITWKELERVLGKREYKKFGKWMMGQTCIKQGAYLCDVKNFLAPGKPIYD